MQEDEAKKGYVYILVNPAFPGFLKVGKTTKEPDARAITDIDVLKSKFSVNIIPDKTKSGTRVEDIQYLPFGEIRLDYGTVSMPHKYTSKELDAETGLYYYGARYYNPAMGRFISADIIVTNFSDPQALNRYSYAGNNPLIYIDPTGQFKLKNLFKSVVVGAVGGAVFVFSGGTASPTLAGLYAGMAAGATGAALAGGSFHFAASCRRSGKLQSMHASKCRTVRKFPRVRLRGLI